MIACILRLQERSLIIKVLMFGRISNMIFRCVDSAIVQTANLSKYLQISLITNLNINLMRNRQREHKMTSISGRNFSGSAMLQAESLQLEVTEFRKQMFFNVSIGDRQLNQIFQKLFFTMSIQELFEQLMGNKKMQISDENELIVPIELVYKERKIEVRLRVPLKIHNIRDSQEKCGKLFEYLEKMIKQRQKQEEQQNGTIVYFKGDSKNKNYRYFQVSDNQCIVKMIGRENKHLTFCHHEALKKNGLFYFKAKLIRTTNKIVLFGICGKDIRELVNPYFNQFFIGMYIYTGEIYANGKATKTQVKMDIVEGKSVIKVEVDTMKNKIAWFSDDVLIHRTDITKELVSTDMYPFVNMYSEGDIVEILHQ